MDQVDRESLEAWFDQREEYLTKRRDRLMRVLDRVSRTGVIVAPADTQIQAAAQDLYQTYIPESSYGQ
ncbi:hypothetical protein EBT31_07580 [bacterium]|nr:hypothetical protein [bacterium]